MFNRIMSKKTNGQDIPWESRVRTPHFHWCVHGVQQLARKLKSCKPCGEKNTKNKKSKNTIPIYISSVHQQMWYIYIQWTAMQLLKNLFLLLTTTWTDLKGIIFSEMSQRKTNTVCYHLYVESKKKRN